MHSSIRKEHFQKAHTAILIDLTAILMILTAILMILLYL